MAKPVWWKRVAHRVAPRPWPPLVKVRRPPPCPEGHVVGPPDFVGVGAQRCGTTWAFRLLRVHPGVATAPGRVKELHFFERALDAHFPEHEAAEYHRFFPRPPGALAGEWSPEYMYTAPVMARLARSAPRAKILAIVRDPVARFRSGLAFHLKNGAPLHRITMGDALARGFYHVQLSRVLRSFPRDQLLVLQFERCIADPRGEVRRLYEFVGLDPDFVDGDIDQARNAGARAPAPLDEAMRRELVETYAADVAALARDFPELDLELWPHFSHVR